MPDQPPIGVEGGVGHDETKKPPEGGSF